MLRMLIATRSCDSRPRHDLDESRKHWNKQTFNCLAIGTTLWEHDPHSKVDLWSESMLWVSSRHSMYKGVIISAHTLIISFSACHKLHSFPTEWRNLRTLWPMVANGPVDRGLLWTTCHGLPKKTVSLGYPIKVAKQNEASSSMIFGLRPSLGMHGKRVRPLHPELLKTLSGHSTSRNPEWMCLVW